MSSLLHITNGDSFTEKLKSLKLKGDIITWREMLCEGKTLTNVGSETFGKLDLSSFIRIIRFQSPGLSKKRSKNIVLCVIISNKIRSYSGLSTIFFVKSICWLYSVGSRPIGKYAEITLVCSGKEDDTDKMYSLCDLSDNKLLNLYENRIVLTQDDIEYADYVWQLYCSDNPIRLENLSDFKSYQFDYLADAIENHLTRFPTIKNGLNKMENSILQLSLDEKPTSKKALLNTMLQNQGGLGFGDSQYERAINRLKPLFTSFNPVRLTKKGKDILGNQTSYYSCIQDNDVYLGGALKYNFLYNTDSDRILKL